jgi:hypothetical protein
MKNSRKLLIVVIVFAGASLFNSCNKQEIENDNFDIKTTVKDYVNVLNAFSLSTVDEITSSNNDDLKSAETWDCLTVTNHPNETSELWPRSWTLDYGTENCECFSGINRRGKIHVALSDWWRNEGAYREITFEDFYFNDNKLDGVKTYLNTGINESGNMTFTKTVADAQLTYGDTATMSWNCEKYSELIEGTETFKFADDVWSVNGGGSGVNIDGKDYNFTITSALIYKNGCFHPVSGVLEFVVPNEETKVIDYGIGECDNIANVTAGGVTEEIDL